LSIVVDASVALKWVLDEPGNEAADALLDDELVAPALWLVEAANALWRLTRRGDLTPDEAKERLMELGNAPVVTSDIEDDLFAAAELANTLGHPVYDCLYLAAAIREDTHVVTADGRFHAVVSQWPAFAGRIRMLETR
jgi:predicted nucleic acid-binding protein